MNGCFNASDKFCVVVRRDCLIAFLRLPLNCPETSTPKFANLDVIILFFFEIVVVLMRCWKNYLSLRLQKQSIFCFCLKQLRKFKKLFVCQRFSFWFNLRVFFLTNKTFTGKNQTCFLWRTFTINFFLSILRLENWKFYLLLI